MKLYDIIEIIKLTEQRGQELLIDALVMGIEIGRGNISDFNDLKSVVEQLKNLKQKIDNSLFSPFIRDDIYDRIINEKENLADVLQSFQNSLRRISQQNIQNGVCQVCNKYVHGQDKMKTIQWECNHLFHQQCVLPNLIIQNQTSPKYQCPICENQTPKDEIMNQLQNNKQQVVSCCPTPACRKKFVFQGQEIYRCQNCKKKYCLRCFSQSHGINKCQTSDNIEFKNGDNYKECPNCKKWIKTSQVDSIAQMQMQKQKYLQLFKIEIFWIKKLINLIQNKIEKSNFQFIPTLQSSLLKLYYLMLQMQQNCLFRMQ